MKKYEAELRVRLILGTFPETITKQQHLSVIFNRFFKSSIVRSCGMLRDRTTKRMLFWASQNRSKDVFKLAVRCVL